MSALLLTPNEARVLAVLVEKSITTPQYYPLTVNAAMLGSNQKNSRFPLMNLSEGDIGAALNQLEAQRLVKRDETSGRAIKWRHQFVHQLLLKTDSAAVLATLILRGPQTLAELKANATVLNGPANVEGVQAVLDDLADRAQPMVLKLPRAAGQSTQRYAHLLCGEAAIPAMDSVAVSTPSSGGASTAALLAQLLERIEALETRVLELETRP